MIAKDPLQPSRHLRIALVDRRRLGIPRIVEGPDTPRQKAYNV